jgi:hypothetical protein
MSGMRKQIAKKKKKKKNSQKKYMQLRNASSYFLTFVF